MALQELDLQLHYQPGKVNKNVDELLRGPTCHDCRCLVAVVTEPQSMNKDGEVDMLSDTKV